MILRASLQLIPASVCGWSMLDYLQFHHIRHNWCCTSYVKKSLDLSLYFFPRYLLLATLQLSDKMPKRINPYLSNFSLERNMCQLLCRSQCSSSLPMPHATLPHFHIFHPSLWLPSSKNHSPISIIESRLR